MHAATTLTTLSVLATSALAFPNPLLQRQADVSSSGHITLIAAHSGSPIHLQPLAASNSSFYIGKPTVSYCPLEEYGSCPVGNVTALEVDGADGGAEMDVVVPGGQAVYVRPSGALAFAPAHSEGDPGIENGTTSGFSYVNGTGAGELGRFEWREGGFVGCPVGVPNPEQAGVYQVFAAIPTLSDAGVPGENVSACIGFDALGTPYTEGFAAWQYD